MAIEEGHKPLAMGRLQEVNHLVDDHVLEQIPWLSHELRVEADGAGARIAAPPLRLHPLEEVPVDRKPELFLPALDQWRQRGVQE